MKITAGEPRSTQFKDLSEGDVFRGLDAGYIWMKINEVLTQVGPRNVVDLADGQTSEFEAEEEVILFAHATLTLTGEAS